MNKHQNKNVGIALTDKMRGQFAELQLKIMKDRERRRVEHETAVQVEVKQLDELANRFAAELDVDMRHYVCNVDTYRFEPRVPTNGNQSHAIPNSRKPGKPVPVPPQE